ncbi:MAG: DUF4142 domain-containing protein [Acidobacteriota bacterium]|nr:DUF4142 domain-containing protein [Acidobacteriota bacterium]
MSTTRSRIVCFSTAALLCAAPVFAQDMPQGAAGCHGAAGSQAATSAADKKFVMKAMQGSMAEIQLGQLATQKASSQEVKDFGQKMVDDHTKLSDQMKPVATDLGVTPPSEVSAKDQAVIARLQGLSGTEFDKAYIRAMVLDHRTDDKEFKAEEMSGKNPQVKDAATQGEPVIAMHLQMATDLAKKMK